MRALMILSMILKAYYELFMCSKLHVKLFQFEKRLIESKLSPKCSNFPIKT